MEKMNLFLEKKSTKVAVVGLTILNLVLFTGLSKCVSLPTDLFLLLGILTSALSLIILAFNLIKSGPYSKIVEFLCSYSYGLILILIGLVETGILFVIVIGVSYLSGVFEEVK